ncbi:MAG: cytoplasmic protein [Deltaproteobacteria bacterium]|nr:cytoplasmic protein [Deltaproteobacteria bacterium]
MRNNPFYTNQANQHRPGQPQGSFGELEATELYCPKCSRAVPVNKFLLLILPDGDKYEYRCRFCDTTVGKKTDKSGQFHDILKR